MVQASTVGTLQMGLVRVGATIALGRFEVGLGAGHGVAGHPGGLRVGTHVMAMF